MTGTGQRGKMMARYTTSQESNIQEDGSQKWTVFDATYHGKFCIAGTKVTANRIADALNKAELFDEIRDAAADLENEISGCWELYEEGLRIQMGNTNYHVVADKANAVRAILAKVNEQ